MTRRNAYLLVFGLVFLGAALIAAYELIASPLQAMFLADYAKRLNYHDGNGPSDRIRFPKFGPHDIRFGYSLLPDFTKNLAKANFAVVRQARISPEMANLDKFGLFLPYREKDAAGLTLEDCSGAPYYRFRQPRHTYPDFAAIPPMVANTLLFIENRELLDPNHPQRNPAVEWDRLGEAVLEKMVQVVQPGHHVPGGSTLATQLEKYRHANGGLTLTPGDKLRQMASASVRAYLDGPDTRVTRRRIVLDYLNTVPLSAAPGFGEVDGLADGLSAWFGLDFDRVNQLLAKPRPTAEAARAYKHVLALLISQRKPSWYLITGRSQLDEQANVHLGLLAQAGIITPAFRDLARKQHIEFRDTRIPLGDTSFTKQKAVSAARNELSAILGVDRLYDLDRLDLTVTTSLHAATQQDVTRFLATLKDPAAAQSAGLYAHRLLSPGDDLSKIIYSFTLYERTADGSALRVQADSLNQPFDINQGAKLGMGSSAKLRTLVTYLEIITELHDQYGKLDRKALDQVQVPPKDVLTQWALDYLRATPDRDLSNMLRAAMDRRYSASTAEGFYTGGGLHHFVNFEKWEDGEVMDLWEAARLSVNLPFIRLMRDIVHHFMYRAPGTAAHILEDAEDPRRQTYLLKFADKEGKTFLLQFYKKYRGLNPDQVTELFFSHMTPYPRRLAAVLRYLEPDADLTTFTRLMKSRLDMPDSYSDHDFAELYAAYAPGKFNLADRAYVAQTHPLELWLVTYLRQHPQAHWDELVQASTQARIDGYDWLFKTSRKNAQDIRIQSLLEIEAFQEIFRRWQRLGYPFSSLVPSYATAIGSSADRPAALADLMGIVLNDGVKQSSATFRRLDFAAGTPYHTVFAHTDSVPKQLFAPEIAQVVREALVNVVTGGTATRINGAFVTQRGKLVIGGKTGTGDNRFDTFASNGAILESRVVNRVATFVFFIGRHFYGVITAYVPGEAAGNYKFTSALPVQVLKAMAPILQPLVAAGESRSLGWKEDLADFEADNIPVTAAAPQTTTEPNPPAPASTTFHYDFRPLHRHAREVTDDATDADPLPLKSTRKLTPSDIDMPAPPPPPPAPAAPPAPASPTPAPKKTQVDKFDPALSVPGEGYRLIN
jgi:membrane peptidoglycan carboxypeptidase